MARRHKTTYRRRNPFAAGSINQLAVKVAGGLAGGIAAATIPNAIMPSMAAGWGGVAAALAIAFGGSWMLKSMSANFAEGVLLGGTLQAAGRVAQQLTGKNLVSFSLGTYGPMQFPVPTPAYMLRAGTGVIPSVPASASASKPMGPRAVSANLSGSKWGPRASKWAA